MAQDQTRRLTTAVGFLSGVFACIDALRDASVSWPPDAVWDAISRPHRLELAGGIALIVVAFLISVVKPGSPAS